MSDHACTVIVFARAPLPGQAKTRLIPALGKEGAAALQQRLLEHTLALADTPHGGTLELWCSPDTGHPAFRRLATQYRIRLKQQRGNDLGERMAHALSTALQQSAFAIIIGTDCPELTAADISHCIRHLSDGCEAVIGPAADGGYYLLGLSRFEPSLFRGVSWGSDKVLDETLQRLDAAGMRWRQLGIKHDLDRPDDLRRFPELY